MDAPLDVWNVPNGGSRDAFATSNFSQPASLYTLPSISGQCFVVCIPSEACSWTNCISATMLTANNYLGNSQQPPYPAYQLESQHVRLDQEYFPNDILDTQIRNTDMAMATASSQAMLPNELPTLASPYASAERPTCPRSNCGRTFKRTYELRRHVTTVHGLKTKCGDHSCRYRTARKDKMKEHVRKMHGECENGGVVRGRVLDF
jgi:hypothetical protein